MKSVFVWAISLCGVCCSAHAEQRVWTDKSGSISFAAEMIGVGKESVRLRLDDGETEYDVPLRLLCEADQEFVKAAKGEYRTPKNGIPDGTMSQIKADAKQKWPGNYSMQEFEIANERGAFRAINNYQAPGIPSDVFDRITSAARRKWPRKYAMQKFEMDNQVEGYRAVRVYSAPEIPPATLREIIARAKQKWRGNYAMQRWEIDQQVESYMNVGR